MTTIERNTSKMRIKIELEDKYILLQNNLKSMHIYHHM